MLQWSGSRPYNGWVICDLCTIRSIWNFGYCVRWSPTKRLNCYESSAVGVRGFILRTGNQLGFPIVARPFLADGRRCTGSFILYLVLVIICVPNRYVVRSKDSPIVDNTPGMPCIVTGLIRWPQTTESNSSCHTACRA